jgi:Mg2+-importing ATPase
MAAGPFWTQTPATAASALGCGVSGLMSAEAATRLATYGRNVDAQAREAGLIISVGRRLLEPLCLILIAAAVVSAATGDAPSALIILVILGASVTLDTLQEGRAKQAAEALRQSVAVEAEVKRDGVFTSVDAETVVPGDVFKVAVGDIIPADAVVLEASAFTANEAALTGELYGGLCQPKLHDALTGGRVGHSHGQIHQPISVF